jgi:hypothetical protein
MTVDGAFIDRPQIGPAYDDRPGHPCERAVRELYLREHYLPITQSGGLTIANSIRELVASICDGLDFPDRQKDGRKRLVKEIVTYDDGGCTERVAAALRGFLT